MKSSATGETNGNKMRMKPGIESNVGIWVCTKCGEKIEQQFDSCWKCALAARRGLPPDEPATLSGSTDPHVLLVALQEIRRRRRLFWVIFILFAPVVWLAAAIFGSNVALYASISWLALFVLANARVLRSKCPRCGHPFHATWCWHNPWTRKCLNCKLRLDSFAP